ncbi:Solute carrier family 2, facilitated glucose transporter member 8 [Stylophora pistillata]|uniref:Solute carrier family 2, facilitated glucose transporter member 8 n=1 Tax=Stylophora pistillata TaxID=50429 RepID=A0A2B4SBX1_STYPI|nr:Solute carrier family 2, facilitated glucose transporter member 8 [Stylophora pistillata]
MHSHSPQSNEMSVFQDRVGRSILATFIAALGTVSFGFCLGYSSSALVDLQSSDAPSAVRLSDDQASWFSSLVTIGAALGSAIGGWAIDKLGRKRTIMFCTVPLVLGWLLISYAKNVAMLYAGRIITGLGCGAVSLTVPVYIAEISAARVRGALGSVNNLAITVGLILAYVAGVFCHWRWLAFIGAIPPMLQIILLFPMPETPCWLLGKNRRSDALESLFWLRGPSADIEDECITIKETIDTCVNSDWLSRNKMANRVPLWLILRTTVTDEEKRKLTTATDDEVEKIFKKNSRKSKICISELR